MLRSKKKRKKKEENIEIPGKMYHSFRKYSKKTTKKTPLNLDNSFLHTIKLVSEVLFTIVKPAYAVTSIKQSPSIKRSAFSCPVIKLNIF